MLAEWTQQDENKPLKVAAHWCDQAREDEETSLMGTSGTFGGSKSGLVPSWVDEPASSPVARPDGARDGAQDGGADSDGWRGADAR